MSALAIVALAIGCLAFGIIVGIEACAIAGCCFEEDDEGGEE